MPKITYKGSINNIPQFYVGDELIEGIKHAEIEYSIMEYPEIKLTAELVIVENPLEDNFVEETKHIKRFTFKEGISNG